jgi:hypothetical protein
VNEDVTDVEEGRSYTTKVAVEMTVVVFVGGGKKMSTIHE